MMSVLSRKLWRDLWGMRGQALAISLVIASGVAMFVMSLSTMQSLDLTLQTYYQVYRFPHVFVSMKRAPRYIVNRVAEIPGVATVEDRVVRDVTLDVPGLREPAVGRLISIPDGKQPDLARLHLRTGWLPEVGRSDEVVVSDAFAEAHGLLPGDTLKAVINGRLKQLRIVGVALSPEFIYQIRPGDVFPDDKRFAVIWMNREPLEAAFDMDGAFNDLMVQLVPGTDPQEIIDRLDDLLEPYGGLGAIDREDQISHRFISDEIAQLRTMALIVPVIFLSVAAFLLNVVLGRIISTQREQIATIKAFGYTRFEVGWHYSQLVLLIVLGGVIMGTAFGAWLATGLTQMYTQFYRFPLLEFYLDPAVVVLGFLVTATAALVGTLASVRRAVILPPAEAMRPEPPATYRPTLVERMGLERFLSQPSRMILRHLERRPLKAALSTLGIALAVAILVLGRFSVDSLDYIIDAQFRIAQRQDLTVTLVEPRSMRAYFELGGMPGVMDAEPFRSLPVRIRKGHRSRLVGVMGLEQSPRLQRLIDDQLNVVSLPPDGLVLNSKLAEVLNVRPGGTVTLEVLEGRRGTYEVPVSAIVSEFIGMAAYMDIRALNRLVHEGNVISGAFLTTDAQLADSVYTKLKETPAVASVTVKEAAIRSFEETLAENMLRMQAFNVLFAVVIAFGVVYNSARISLAERSRELASLRVIGLTRGEISFILLGELAVLTGMALPLGLGIGYGLVWLATLGLDTELYRIPLIISPPTYALAVSVVIVAAVFSGLVVRRRLDHLDLVEVLKTRE